MPPAEYHVIDIKTNLRRFLIGNHRSDSDFRRGSRRRRIAIIGTLLTGRRYSLPDRAHRQIPDCY